MKLTRYKPGERIEVLTYYNDKWQTATVMKEKAIREKFVQFNNGKFLFESDVIRTRRIK